MSRTDTPETNVTALTRLYPSLELPEFTDHKIFEGDFEISLNSELRTLRETFISAWQTLVEIQRDYINNTGETRTRTQLEKLRTNAYTKTINSLIAYTFTLNKDQLNTPFYKKNLLTHEHIKTSKEVIRRNLIELKGKHELFDNLLTELSILDSKNAEFSSKVLVILHREILNREVQYTNIIVQQNAEIERAESKVNSRVEEILKDERHVLIQSQLEVEQLKEVINQNNSENLTLKRQVEYLSKQLGDSTAHVEELIDESNKNSKNAILETEQLKSKLDSATTQITDLSEENKNLQKGIKQAQIAYGTLDTDRNHLKNELEKLQLSFNETTNRNNDLKNEITQKDGKYEYLSRTLQKHVNTIQESQTTISKLEQQYKKSQDELDTTRQELGRKYDLEKTYEDKITDLQNQVLQLQINLNNASDAASLEYTFNKTVSEELSGSDEERIRLLEEAVENLTTTLNEERKRADNLEQELNRRINAMPDSDEDSNAGDNTNATIQPIVKGLSLLFTKEDKLAIPIFSGKESDPLITSWLREAETLATLNNWDAEEKVRYFSQRLRGEAAEWLEEYLRDHNNENYDYWKDCIIERFLNESDIDQLKNTLHNLAQAPGQRTKSYIAKINGLFDDVYGKVRALAPNADQATKDLRNDVEKIRDEQKRKIILKGLLPKITKELWSRMTKDATYDEVCEFALTSESVVINKEINGEKTQLLAAVAVQQEQSKDLAHKMTENDLLRQQISLLMAQIEKDSKNNKHEQGNKQEETTVAVVNSQPPRQSGNFRPSRGNSQVRFSDQNSRSRNESRTRQQDQGTGYSNTHSRNQSRDRNQDSRQSRFSNYHSRSITPNRNNRPYNSTPPIQQGNQQQFITPQGPPQFQQNAPHWVQPQYAQRQAPPFAHPNSYGPPIEHDHSYAAPLERQRLPYYQNGPRPQRSSNWSQQGSHNHNQQQRPNYHRDKDCYNCGKKGHISRQCYSRSINPSMQ